MVGLLEKQLISRCRNGDADAFALLIKQYKRPLFSYLLRLSGDRLTAEDLFQDTLIRVWKGMNMYSEQNRFSSWLFSIAHNIAVDSFRKKKLSINVKSSENIDTLGNDNNNPSHNVEYNETKNILAGALNALSDKQKNVFLLRQYGELSFKEIAETTGEPLNTVLSHMHYAVKKLRKILRDKNVI